MGEVDGGEGEAVGLRLQEETCDDGWGRKFRIDDSGFLLRARTAELMTVAKTTAARLGQALD